MDIFAVCGTRNRIFSGVPISGNAYYQRCTAIPAGSFVEHTVNGQSIFISVRAKSLRHLVKGILSVSTKFLIIYAFFWLMAGLIGASLFSTGLTIVSFRLMLYAVLMKCLDILAQYLIMLGIYIATRQVTIGFLVLVAEICSVSFRGIGWLIRPLAFQPDKNFCCGTGN